MLRFEQEAEIAQTDELGHALVQHAQIDRVQRRIDDETGNEQDERQAKQESCCRAPVARIVADRRFAERRFRLTITPVAGTLVPSAMFASFVPPGHRVRFSSAHESLPARPSPRRPRPDRLAACSFASIVGMVPRL